MNASLGHVAGLRRGVVLLVVGLAVVAAPPSVRACSTKSIQYYSPRALAAARASSPNTYTEAWNAYYQSALDNLSPRAYFPTWLRRQVANPTVDVTGSSVFDYLTWRRSLISPQWFDRWHPDLAWRFTTPQVATPTINIPVTPTIPTNPVPQETIPPKVPEPSTAVIAVGMIAATLWARSRRRQSQA